MANWSIQREIIGHIDMIISHMVVPYLLIFINAEWRLVRNFEWKVEVVKWNLDSYKYAKQILWSIKIEEELDHYLINPVAKRETYWYILLLLLTHWIYNPCVNFLSDLIFIPPSVKCFYQPIGYKTYWFFW